MRIVVAHENITERKLAEAELLWKSTQLEAQLESSIDGILVVDNHGNKVLQNRRMGEIWKIPPQIVAAKGEAAQLVFVTNQTKNPKAFIERVTYFHAHPDEVGQDEIEMTDGTILDQYSSPICDGSGKHYGRIWSFRDITESRKMENAFRQAQKMESIGQLAGGIAHDFNNILAATVGSLYLAKMDAAEHPAILESLEDISDATQRAGGSRHPQNRTALYGAGGIDPKPGRRHGHDSGATGLAGSGIETMKPTKSMKQLTGWTQSQEVDFQTLLQLQNALSSLAQVALAGAYITFQVGDQICALNVAHIWKVAPLSTIEPLAQVPDYICGVMESEGERIPVLDLRRRMQIEAKTPSGMEHVLLAHFGKLPGSRQRIAILVDCVHKLHSFAFDEITVLPATAGLVPANLAWGSVQRQQKRIVLLSLSRLFPRDLASMLADKVAGTGKPADRQSWFNQLCLAANFQAN